MDYCGCKERGGERLIVFFVFVSRVDCSGLSTGRWFASLPELWPALNSLNDLRKRVASLFESVGFNCFGSGNARAPSGTVSIAPSALPGSGFSFCFIAASMTECFSPLAGDFAKDFLVIKTNTI